MNLLETKFNIKSKSGHRETINEHFSIFKGFLTYVTQNGVMIVLLIKIVDYHSLHNPGVGTLKQSDHNI